jgi:hypothetical protein
MKSTIIAAAILGLTASAGLAGEAPVELTAAQMDEITAGALVAVNATALNNVSANVPVAANVVALSSGVAQNASQTARNGNPVFVNGTNQP